MTVNQFISTNKSQITARILEFMAQKRITQEQLITVDEALFDRLTRFSTAGKLIRGNLLLLGFKLFNQEMPQEVVSAAAAIELTQCAFLVHDDILDQDTMRRGKPSIHAQYMRYGERLGLGQEELQHFGQSMAILVGDYFFLWAFELLQSLYQSDLDHEFIGQAVGIYLDKMSSTVNGEMADFQSASSDSEPDIKQIYQIYEGKTALYTLAAPLMIGASLAGATVKELEIIESASRKLGIAFQIKDDQLGLTATADKLGKPEGSDLRENMKTIFRYHLYQKAGKEEKEKLNQIFGNPDLNPKQLGWIRELLKVWGISELVDQEIRTLIDQSQAELEQLEMDQEAKAILFELVDYFALSRGH